MAHRPAALVAVSLVAVLSLLGGCASGATSADDTSEPVIPAVLPEVDPSTLVLPLDPYVYSSRNLQATTKAESLLLGRCLARFGLPGPTAQPAVVTSPSNGRRYGIYDAEQAAVRGYHGPARAAADPQQESSISPVVQAVTEETGQSSYGGQQVPDGGCIGEARRTIERGAPAVADPQLGTELSHDSWLRSQQDSRVRAAVGRWSACMKRAGFEYADPLKANDDPLFVSPEPSTKEIAVAVVDVGCKRESDVVKTWATVEAPYQKRALNRNAEALEIIRRNYDARERNAARLLAGGS